MADHGKQLLRVNGEGVTEALTKTVQVLNLQQKVAMMSAMTTSGKRCVIIADPTTCIALDLETFDNLLRHGPSFLQSDLPCSAS